jgi:hypothetical protein
MLAPLPVNLHEYEPLARAKLSEMAWDYLAGGGGDERTLQWNRERLNATRILPRVLRDVSTIDMKLTLLGLSSSAGSWSCRREWSCRTCAGSWDVRTSPRSSTARATRSWIHR